MKELLLSVLAIKTEGYCFLGWVFLLVWFMDLVTWHRRILYFSQLNVEKVHQGRECFRSFNRMTLWFRKDDAECIMETVIAATLGEKCHMPLHAFTIFSYLPLCVDSKLFFSVLLWIKCYFLVIKQKGESNKYTFLSIGIWLSYF